MPSTCMVIRDDTRTAVVARWGLASAHWRAYSATVILEGATYAPTSFEPSTVLTWRSASSLRRKLRVCSTRPGHAS